MFQRTLKNVCFVVLESASEWPAFLLSGRSIHINDVTSLSVVRAAAAVCNNTFIP